MFVPVLLLCTLLASPLRAKHTVGLFENDTASFEGYTLFSPMHDTTAYLIDHYGRLVHTWQSGGIRPGFSIYLLENGNLLWNATLSPSASGGSRVLEIDWDGNIVWNWEDDDPSYRQHHDIEPMPNGNVLILARDIKTAAEAFAAGRDTLKLLADKLWLEMVLEVQPTGPTSGTIVWQWTGWDHLIQDFDPARNNFGVIADHPELMDINYGNKGSDWLHANSLAYNPDLDQIVIGFRAINEFWVIDHSTSTAEAASHTGGQSGMGGDIIYRWGNPQVYQAGDSTNQTLSRQHDVTWIPPGYPGAGNFLIFNNRDFSTGSQVVELASPVLPGGEYPSLLPGEPHLPISPIWTYAAIPPQDFFASFISGARRLPNGNTLICHGRDGEFREVNINGEIVWKYISPVSTAGRVTQGDPVSGSNDIFRCTRYAADYPGLAGRDLTPTSALEIYPVTISGTTYNPQESPTEDTVIFITASILADSGIATAIVIIDTGTGDFSVPLFDDGAHQDGLPGDDLFGAVIGQISGGTRVSYYLEVVDGTTALVNDPPNPPLTIYRFEVEYGCGNVDGIYTTAGPSDISDLTYLVSYLFGGGSPPPSLDAANIDGQSSGGLPVDISDLTYLVSFMFGGGPAPVCE